MAMSIKKDGEYLAADWVSIGKRARSAREAIGYSVDQLALTCGLAHAEINAIEDGEDTDEAHLARVAAALKVPVAQLLGSQI